MISIRNRPSSPFFGQPLAIIPSALDLIEDAWAAGPGQSTPRAALSPPQGSGTVRTIVLSGPIMTGLPQWLVEAIGAADPVTFAAEVRAAAADPDVTGIVLLVDSPGGSVTAVDAAAAAVREAQTQKPVVAYAPNMAASAAYWIISGAQQILTSSTGLIGSIGTFARWVDQSAAAEQAGMQVHVYRSAPGKAPGQPGEARSAELDTALTEMVDAMQGVFSAAVAAGRGVPLATVQAQYATGRVWVGEHAVAAGIADQIGTFADAVALAGGSVSQPMSRSPARTSAALTAAGGEYDNGQRVRVKGTPHMKGHSTGTVKLVEGPTYAYGIVFDGMEDMGVHKWYLQSELETTTATAPDGKKKPMKMKGELMTAAQLAALGLSADATEPEILAAIEARNQAQTQHAALTGRITAALGLPEGAAAPSDPLAALTAQAADGRVYRDAQLDRLHALTITTEGNDAAGIQAADDARAVYAEQTLERINAQITRLEAKRDTLPNGPQSKQPSDQKPAPKPLSLGAYGLQGRR